MKAGRKLQFTLDELKTKCDDYFNKCDEDGRPYTVSGLANELGVSRQCLINYEDHNKAFNGLSEEEIEEFIDTVKNAKGRILQYAEESLWTQRNPAGVIFNLKNNWGWKDVQEVNNSTVISQKSALNELTTQEIKTLLGNTLEEE